MISRVSIQAFALLATVLLFQACSTTGTQDATPQPNSVERFNRIDTNRDGRLSLDEVNNALVSALFEARDTNKDGVLSLEEWAVPGEPAGRETFAKHDLNGDGTVTLLEARTYARKHGIAPKFMNDADTNRDGYVSLEEATAYYARTEGPVR